MRIPVSLQRAPTTATAPTQPPGVSGAQPGIRVEQPSQGLALQTCCSHLHLLLLAFAGSHSGYALSLHAVVSPAVSKIQAGPCTRACLGLLPSKLQNFLAVQLFKSLQHCTVCFTNAPWRGHKGRVCHQQRYRTGSVPLEPIFSR